MSVSNSKLKMLSLFTGAGGLDLGFEAAGFETLACVEVDSQARQTLALNRPEWDLLSAQDVHDLPIDNLTGLLGLQVGELDLLLGGPPCQPFSKAAYWREGKASLLNDPRANTLHAMLDVAENLLPRAIVIENVPAIAYRGQNEGIRFIRRRLREINRKYGTSYVSSLTVLNAVEFGAPQIRERAFIVVLRDGRKFRSPLPTNHAKVSDARNERLFSAVTAGDALLDVAPTASELKHLELKGKWADLLPTIPEGHNYLFHTPKGEGLPLFGWRTRYWSFLLKLKQDLPSWTISANPGPAIGPFHWENRLLSVREMCRLQAFPDNWEVCGNYRAARRQIGNAVPPPLGEAVARRLKSLLSNEIYSKHLNLAQKARLRPIRYVPPQPVPEKYLTLIGDHKDHPGSGLGPAAINWSSLNSTGNR